MGTNRILGIVLIVVGLFLAYTGFTMSESIGNQVSEAVTGSPTDSVTLRYVGALVCIASGAFLAK